MLLLGLELLGLEFTYERVNLGLRVGSLSCLAPAFVDQGKV